MTRDRTKFKLTERLYKNLQKRGKIQNCWRCGKPFNVGDVVISVRRNTGRSALKKWYHEKCAEECGVWI
jgi:hypothetical protein